ncbi:MAG: hypothetical protein OHK0023_18890 [Anaerolineae bacterium]
MTQIVYLIEQIAPGIYLLCAAGVLLGLRRMLLAQGDLRIAEFELERELAERRRANAITWTLGTIEFALAVAAIAFVVAPTVRADLLNAGLPTSGSGGNAGVPERFETSTPGGDGSAGDAILQTVTAQALSGGGPALLLTEVASPTPVGTIIAGYPTPVGCDSPQAQLKIPANGMIVFDTLTAVGLANVPDFAFYKLELAGPSTGGEFAPPLGNFISPVIEEGVLGQIPLYPFAPGDYRFRLAVFDSTGTIRASCTVWVIITSRPATPTPVG